MKLSMIATAGLLMTLALPAAHATEVREAQGKLLVTVDSFSEAYDLFKNLKVREERADQGFLKRFIARDGAESLSLSCNFDHRTSCELSYQNAKKIYLTEQGRSGIVFPSPAISGALYQALDFAPITGFGQLRKQFMTADSRLEIECVIYESEPSKTRCMIEVIGR